MRSRDPVTAIVAFFMTQPLVAAEMALGTMKAIVTSRRNQQTEEETKRAGAPVKRRVRKKKVAVAGAVAGAQPAVQVGTSPGVAETAVATPVVGAETVGTVAPRKRGRPLVKPLVAPGAVVTPGNPTGAMPPLGTGTTTGQG